MEFVLESKEQGLDVKKYLNKLNNFVLRTEKVKFEDWIMEAYQPDKDYYEVTYITLISLDELSMLRKSLDKDILVCDSYCEPESSKFIKANVLLIRDYYLD